MLINHNYPFVAGNVRAESFTRPKQFQNGIINGVQESRQHQETYVNFDCTPDPTLGEALQETEEPSTSDSETEDLLQQFASKHYYRYVLIAEGAERWPEWWAGLRWMETRCISIRARVSHCRRLQMYNKIKIAMACEDKFGGFGLAEEMDHIDSTWKSIQSIYGSAVWARANFSIWIRYVSGLLLESMSTFARMDKWTYFIRV